MNAVHPKYNGYKNYQTWNVALWLNNDEVLYRAAQDWVAKRRERKARLLAFRVKHFVMCLLPEGTPDLSGRAKPYSGVKWSEVARAISEE